MKRRCEFLDNLPSFNFNYGHGEYIGDTGNTTDTSQLGSTLMNTMLKEVRDFCDVDSKENWASKPHHQVQHTSCVILLIMSTDKLNLLKIHDVVYISIIVHVHLL